MLMRNKIFILFFILGNGAFCQNQVCLELRDSNHLLMEGVYVKILEQKGKSGITDEKGLICFQLKSGKYKYQINLIGYERISEEIDLKKDTAIRLILKSSIHNIEPIVITANKRIPNSAVYKPGKIEISPKSISQFPRIFGESDPVRFVQLLPGVSFAHEFSSDLYIRGGGKDQTMFAINQTPVFAQDHLHGLYSAFNIDMLKTMNLYISDIPGKFGSYGMSVLDFEMDEETTEKVSGAVKLSLLANSVFIKAPIIKNKWSLAASFRNTYTFFADETLGEFWEYHVISNYKIDSFKSVHLFVQSGNDFFAFTGDMLPNFTFINRSFFGQIKYKDDNFLKFGVFNLMFSHSQNNRVAIFKTNNPLLTEDTIQASNDVLGQEYYSLNSSLVFATDIFNFDVGIQSYLGLNTTRNGFNEAFYEDDLAIRNLLFYHRLNKLVYSRGLNVVPYGDVRFNKFGYDFHGAFRLNLFKNLDDQSSYIVPEGTMSVSRVFTHNTILLSLDRRTQINHSINPYFLTSSVDRWVYSNDYLRPQIANQLSLTYQFKNERFNIPISVYGKNFQNLYVYRDGADVSSFNFNSEITETRGLAYGFEAAITFNNSWQSANINYTYSRSFLNSFDINEGRFFPADFDRPHNFKYYQIFKIRKNTNLSILGMVASGRPFTAIISDTRPFLIFSDRNAYRLPLYRRVDVSFNHNRYFFKGKVRTELAFGAYNALGFVNPFILFFDGGYGSINSEYLSYRFYNLFAFLPFVSFEVRW